MPGGRRPHAAAPPSLSPYNICRLLAAHGGNRTLAAHTLGITPLRLNRILAAHPDEYRLLIFLFSPGIRAAYTWFRREPLFARQQARKYYDIHRERIRAFKQELRRQPVGDHFALYRKLFQPAAPPHRTLALAIDDPNHHSLYSIVLTLHLCAYRPSRAALRLGLSRYRLAQALRAKLDETLALLLLFNRSPRPALAAAKRLRLPVHDWHEFVAAQKPLLAAYRAQLRAQPGDPYAAYQVVYKGHVPGQAGFDEAVLKRMLRVWRRESARERGAQPLLFSLPDAFLHPHLLDKVRASSFHYWHDAMQAFITREKLPFTYNDLNRREEERLRGVLAQQALRRLREEHTRHAAEARREPVAPDLPSAADTAAPPDDDRHTLVRRAQSGDRAAEQELLRRHQRLITSLALPLSGRGLDADDLASEGALGLLHALRRFDPSRPVRFSTYATWWIRKYLHEALARHLGLSTYHYEQLLKVQHAQRDWLRRRSETPDAALLAQLTGINRDEVEALLLRGGGLLSLDAGLDGSEGLTLGETLTADAVTDKLMLDEETAHTLNGILREHLSLREEAVIRYRMGFGPGFIALPLEEVGKLLRVSRTAIQMIERSARLKLNAPALRPFLQDLL